MISFSNRRTLLKAAMAFLPFSMISIGWAAEENKDILAQKRLAKLEGELGGRLGVFALNMADDTVLKHRANERFPLCSTFKALLAAAILERSLQDTKLMQQHIHYKESDLVSYSPMTEKHAGEGMIVTDLWAAMIQYSDNTAANLLMKILGGPEAVTAFARSVGDHEFRLDRWETDLNEAMPGDLRDTSTPESYGRALQRLVLGDALEPHLRQQLQDGLRGNTTGAKRIRAGVPSDWHVGDRTGSGPFGTANVVGVLWPPNRAPIIVAIYTTQHEKDAKWRDDIIVMATRVIVDWLG